MHWPLRLKFWFFANYWWLVVVAIAIATALLLCLKESVSSVVAVVGSLLSLLYFLQKQKLEELRLFRDLFKDFNARYDAMNDRFAVICRSNEGAFEASEQQLLIDYFNLCGEEYLYYQQGYIPPAVWESWHRGMQLIIACPRVNELWRVESASGSYYGLPLKPFNYAPQARADA